MPVYATRADALALYGDTAVIVATDPESTGFVGSFDAGLTRASQDIDGYILRAGKTLPATAGDAPGWFVPACIDIAIYMVSADAGSATVEKKARADYWRKCLQDAYPVRDGSGNPIGASGALGVTLEAQTRVFTRDTMGGLL